MQEQKTNPSNDLNSLPLLIFTHNQAGISEGYREFSGNVIHIGAQARPGRTAQSPANGNGKHLTKVFPKMEIIKAVVSGIGQAHFILDTGNYEFDSFNVHQAISGALGTRATETEEMK